MDDERDDAMIESDVKESLEHRGIVCGGVNEDACAEPENKYFCLSITLRLRFSIAYDALICQRRGVMCSQNDHTTMFRRLDY